MERNVFDSIGLILIFVDIMVMGFYFYKFLFNNMEVNVFQKVFFIGIGGLFTIVTTMAILQRLFYSM